MTDLLDASKRAPQESTHHGRVNPNDLFDDSDSSVGIGGRNPRWIWFVIPAKAGIQCFSAFLDSRLRGSDDDYETNGSIARPAKVSDGLFVPFY